MGYGDEAPSFARATEPTRPEAAQAQEFVSDSLRLLEHLGKADPESFEEVGVRSLTESLSISERMVRTAATYRAIADQLDEAADQLHRAVEVAVGRSREEKDSTRAMHAEQRHAAAAKGGVRG